MKKLELFFLAGICLLISSCYSHKKVIESGLPYSNEISWPEEFEPSKSGFFVHNEINIKATPQKVWNIFIQAEKWGEWYDMGKGLKIQNTPDGRLSESSVFKWYPEGHEFTSTVKKFEPPYKIDWYAQEKDMKMTVYHGWMIIPTEEGCKVISQESQNGPITKLERLFTPNKVNKSHTKWLNGLKLLAEKEN